MGSSPFNPRWPSLGEHVDPEVRQAIRLLYNGFKDHQDAFSALIKKVNAASASSPSSTSSETVVSPSGGGSGVTSLGLAMPPDFSVQNSPLNGPGTLIVAWLVEAANLVLAGPASGAAATPVWRALVAADIQVVFEETPVGLINGSNAVFTLARSPSPANSLQLFLNGQRLTSGGADFTLLGTSITMVLAPAIGDSLIAGLYFY